MKRPRLSLSTLGVAVIAVAALLAPSAGGKTKAQAAAATGSAISLKSRLRYYVS